MKLKTFLNTFSVILLVIAGSLIVSCTGNSTGSKDKEIDSVLNPNETYNTNLAGVHIFVDYDPEANLFNGYIENTTENIITRVGIRIHLSSGVKLGPTPAVDLLPGERKELRLSAKNFEFESWSVDPEIGGNDSQQ